MAEEDVLRVEGEVARISEDEIEPLLRDETRGEGEDRRLPAAQTRGPLERDATALLPLEVLGGEATRDEGVARRIPDLLVDPVDDADEAVAQSGSP